MRPASLMCAAPLLSVFATAGGCMSTHVRRVARFETGSPTESVERPAPASATYRVMYASTGRSGLHRLGGSRRIVGQGEPIGFARSEDGRLVGVAGDEQVPLDKLPASARYCVWVAQVKQESQFGKEVGKATDTTGRIVAGAAVVAAVVAGAGLTAYVDSLDSCDDDGDGSTSTPSHHGHHHHHHHHHHHGNGRDDGDDDD